MSVKERLKEFIKFKGLSERSFCLKIGVSTGFVGAIRQSIQPDKIKSIAIQYPELNTGWLLTGNGDMLNNTVSKNIAPSERQEMLLPVSVFESLQEERKRHDEYAAELLRQNAQLQDMLQEQLKENKKINVLPESDAGCVAATGSDK